VTAEPRLYGGKAVRTPKGEPAARQAVGSTRLKSCEASHNGYPDVSAQHKSSSDSIRMPIWILGNGPAGEYGDVCGVFEDGSFNTQNSNESERTVPGDSGENHLR